MDNQKLSAVEYIDKHYEPYGFKVSILSKENNPMGKIICRVYRDIEMSSPASIRDFGDRITPGQVFKEVIEMAESNMKSRVKALVQELVGEL